MPDSVLFSVSRESDLAIRSELERIHQSASFAHSHRIRRFLQFVVEEYLEGRQHRLKEYLIGLEVFGRPESFDPRVDSIVRVEARRLRAKLDEYYAREGAESVLRIQLRKGSYVPLFETATVAPRSAMASSRRTARPSIALASLMASNGESAFAEEIRRRLTHHLTAEPGLRVVVGGASDYVLEGSVETTDASPRLFLQLMNVAEQAWVWSRTIDDAPWDLSFCERTARAVWRAILGATSESDCSRSSQNGASFAAYLQGLYSWRSNRPQSFTASIASFTQAVETDPGYAAAWAALAEALVAGSLLDCGDSPETHSRAREAARRSIELNDALPESRLARAAVSSFFDWQWAEGEKEFERAICLDPVNSGAHVLYGLQLACCGNRDRARGEFEEAERLDPVSLAAQFAQGWIGLLEGDRDEATRRFRLIAVLEPDSPWSYLGLGQVAAAQEGWSEAIAHLTTASHLLSGRFLFSGCLGYCYAKSGRRDEALQMLHRLPESGAPAVNSASIYAGLGDVQRAFSCLQQSAVARESCLPFLLLGPDFNALRGESQYRALQATMGLGALVASAA